MNQIKQRGITRPIILNEKKKKKKKKGNEKIEDLLATRRIKAKLVRNCNDAFRKNIQVVHGENNISNVSFYSLFPSFLISFFFLFPFDQREVKAWEVSSRGVRNEKCVGEM